MTTVVRVAYRSGPRLSDTCTFALNWRQSPGGQAGRQAARRGMIRRTQERSSITTAPSQTGRRRWICKRTRYKATDISHRLHFAVGSIYFSIQNCYATTH